MRKDGQREDCGSGYFDAKRIKEYLSLIDEFHRDGDYRWEVGFIDQLLWEKCCACKTTHVLRDQRKAALEKLSPLARSCVTGAERVMELLSVKITEKAIVEFTDYLRALERPYQAECNMLVERRVLEMKIDDDIPTPENEVFRLTEFVLPKLSKFISATVRTEQESVYGADIEPYLTKTLDRIEIEEPACWANICIIAPILRRIKDLAECQLESYDEPLSFKCDVDGEWWSDEDGDFENAVWFELGKGQPQMSGIRLSLEGRQRKWSETIGDYSSIFADAAMSRFFNCKIKPTDDELKSGGGVLHFRLAYHLKTCRTRNDFREFRFDRSFKLKKPMAETRDNAGDVARDLSIESWLETREKTETMQSEFRAHDVVGDYEIMGLIGRGGTGEVYCAQHRVLGTRVAIKFLFKDSENARARFTNEARVLASEKDEGFPQFFAYGEHNGRPYLVEEQLSIGDFPCNDGGVADFLVRFCPAIDHLHQKGYVHRDIKPNNILFRGQQPVLVDFGLVKKMEAEIPLRASLSIVNGKAVGVGTPGYASPEQLIGDVVDRTTDIHALGMLIAEFFGNELPRQWEPIVNKATNSRRQARYQSIDELMLAVRNR